MARGDGRGMARGWPRGNVRTTVSVHSGYIYGALHVFIRCMPSGGRSLSMVNK